MTDRERMTRPVLIAYDGSAESQTAVIEAARLFPHRPAIVLSAWRSVAAVVPASLSAIPPSVAFEAQTKLDSASQGEAFDRAEEGAALAAEYGLDAQAVSIEAAGAVWPAIVHSADRHDAAAVVLGSRGLSGLKAAVLGSVSAGVVHHCTRPVLIVRSTPAD